MSQTKIKQKKAVLTKKFSIFEFVGIVSLSIREAFVRDNDSLTDSLLAQVARAIEAANFDYEKVRNLKTTRARTLFEYTRVLAMDARLGYSALLYGLSMEAAEKFFNNHPACRVKPSEDYLSVIGGYLPPSGAMLWPGWGVEAREHGDDTWGIHADEYCKRLRQLKK